MKPRNRMLLSAVATLMGTVVGAGFLGIPKALTLSGFLPGVLIMIIVSIMMFNMCLFTTELALNTKKVFQMPGIIRKYVGRKAGVLASIVFAFISFGAMVAYLIGCSEILSAYSGINQLICMIGYFIIIFFIVYKGLKVIEKAELYLAIGLILFLIVFWYLMRTDFNINNLLITETTNLVLPLGVIIFSFGGFNVMTQIEEITNGDKDLMIKTCVLGILIPFIFFFSFAVLMLGVYGVNVADIATETLTGFIGFIGNSIAFLAMTSSYIISGLLLKDMLIDDYGLKNTKSVIISMVLPFLFTVFAAPGFINTLAFTGSVFAGLFAVLVCLTVVIHRKKIRKTYYKTPGGIITPLVTSIFFLISLISLII
jgi:amino acid permease